MAMEIEVEAFRQRALLELAQIEQALKAGADSSGVVVLDQSCTGRLSRMDAMQQQAMGSGLAERLRVQKRKLLAALERMREGQFGICCQYHEGLPLERLEADLAAPFCMQCQQEIDEKRKGG
jgi:DnaK suppressor protein